MYRPCVSTLSALAQDHEPFHTTHQQRNDWVPWADDDRVARRPLLDKPTDPHPILTLLMDEALTRILLTADGAVAALKERTTGAYADTMAPRSALAADLEELNAAYQKCKTHRARLMVIRHAQTVADALRPIDRSRVHGTTEWREKVAHDMRPCRILAGVYGVSESTVKRIKRSAGTSSHPGRPKRGHDLQSG